MSRLNLLAPLMMAGLPPTSRVDCHAENDLMAALGGWGEANSMGAWSEADGLGDLMGELSGLSGDDEEIGRRVRRAAQRAGTTAQSMFAAIQRRLAQGGGGGGGSAFPAQLPPMERGAVMSSIAPGTPARGERFAWIPFPANAFVAGGPSSLVLKTTSQRQFRTVRMAGVERRTNGAGPPATSSILLTVTEVKIGQEVQPAATGAVGFDVFSPLAVGLPVYFDPIDVNMPLEVTVTASAVPAAGERIDFAVSFHGYSIK